MLVNRVNVNFRNTWQNHKDPPPCHLSKGNRNFPPWASFDPELASSPVLTPCSCCRPQLCPSVEISVCVVRFRQSVAGPRLINRGEVVSSGRSGAQPSPCSGAHRGDVIGCGWRLGWSGSSDHVFRCWSIDLAWPPNRTDASSVWRLSPSLPRPLLAPLLGVSWRAARSWHTTNVWISHLWRTASLHCNPLWLMLQCLSEKLAWYRRFAQNDKAHCHLKLCFLKPFCTSFEESK